VDYMSAWWRLLHNTGNSLIRASQELERQKKTFVISDLRGNSLHVGTGNLFWPSRELNRAIREIIRLIREAPCWRGFTRCDSAKRSVGMACRAKQNQLNRSRGVRFSFSSSAETPTPTGHPDCYSVAVGPRFESAFSSGESANFRFLLTPSGLC
jgi:hypothetical protein